MDTGPLSPQGDASSSQGVTPFPQGITMGQSFQDLFTLAGSFAPRSSSPVLLAMSAVVPMALPAQWHPNPHIQSSMTWMKAEDLW